ncbi:NAD(P)/FAD-dependent oxidoreductase [Deferribacter autotrophicus]|uniref:NAD(P)/FAD-dependent oxidoreductase n=1 Tax=Deferribacter autotrophicus TaxID=500465 RepID=A0A5A8F5G4_9BACT|nr:FAD-dependent oxidoreductase [Deferribacter autotrophicus]KAA0256869.1 NAD(P)/FAD-dependent oxidoreductase [Deferribacter autotrophicus]
MKIVTIGTGMAASEFVEKLRHNGYRDEIVMIGNEEFPPYSPCVLPFFLAGEPLETVYWKGQDFYKRYNVTTRLGHAVVKVDTESRRIYLDNGMTETYDMLFFATGGKSWYPRPEWLEIHGVFGFKTLTDMLAIDSYIRENNIDRVVVFGGGFIGVDAALSLWHRGLKVTLVHRNTRVLSQMTDQEGGAFATKKLIEITGIDIRLQTVVSDIIEEAGQLKSVKLSNGESVDTKLMIVAIGVSPNSEPLTGDDSGVKVDENLKADSNIYVAGDVAVTPHAITGKSGIYATYPNAMMQARTAVRNIIYGKTKYEGSINTNVLKKHINFPIISAGAFEGEAITWQNNDLFRRVYLKNGKINGYQLIGDTRISGYIYNLYRSQTRVEGIIKEILSDNKGDCYYRRMMGFNT